MSAFQGPPSFDAPDTAPAGRATGGPEADGGAPHPTDAVWDGPAPVEVLPADPPAGCTVFASPHSGRHYPAAFVRAARLDPLMLRRSEDAFVDEIYAAAPRHGAALIKATFPRAYVDPNREPWELDPAMFTDPLPQHVNTQSLRVRAGLGTVARVVTNGAEIYGGRLPFAEARARIEALYMPYHRALAALVERTRARHGACLLVDCHSMPSIGGPMDADSGSQRVDVVLGDRNGTSCAARVVDLAQDTLEGLGFVVTRNAPYAGGYTTHHYGRPDTGVHALQIEINRALYMDEEAVRRTPGLDNVRGRIERLIAALATIEPGPLAP